MIFRQKKTAFFEKTINKNLDLTKNFNCFNQLLDIRLLKTLLSGWGTEKGTAENLKIFFVNNISETRKQKFDHAWESIPNRRIELKQSQTAGQLSLY